jgi:hypothetical protein
VARFVNRWIAELQEIRTALDAQAQAIKAELLTAQQTLATLKKELKLSLEAQAPFDAKVAAAATQRVAALGFAKGEELT